MTITIESDVVVIGAGITAAMFAERLAETTAAAITVIEAGNSIFNLAERHARRERYLHYQENPWPGDHIEGHSAEGMMSRSMSVGGQAMHWGGVTPRFTPEDFRVNSLYGVGYDWPLTYDELDPFYQEAEERMGVAGEQGPPQYDRRARDYPLPPLPMSYNIARLRTWGEKSGIPFWRTPVAKLSEPYRGRNVCMRCDTCNICPTGAKYSPDFSFRRLVDDKRIELHSRRLVRKLVLREDSDRIEYAEALDRDRPDEPVRYRAKTFVVAAGYCWSPHLLLLSANPRYPDGLANRSGHVGKYMTGHRAINNFVEIPEKLYPGVYIEDSLLSKRFQAKENETYIRHDLRIWESDFARRARLKDADGKLMLGDAILDEWRARSATGTAQLRAYYDVIPARESSLTLSPTARNPWGDPLPVIRFLDSHWTSELRAETEATILRRFDEIVAAGGGKSLAIRENPLHDHPCGGCRMGEDPATSVVDPWGRTHDHENLWVVGTPTLVSSGCNNGTLTFSALALRSAAALARELPAPA
ncbi:MAG: GMC family oxidoreductase [Gammaproteobacteria bacterium]|nr:GMC family oxidoreductase [Gammaproteobacteria bacterium]MDH4256254.1 GMC family oxidoreductase [Gammaproteobacteria bacterium]MDH5310633.1 GMC family oxidoreductase [Gammaproteobacteria bacterium]